MKPQATNFFQPPGEPHEATLDAVLNRVVHASADLALRVSHAGVIQEVFSRGTFESEGVDEWVGRNWAETVIPDTREKVGQLLTQAEQTGMARERQVNHTLPGGREVPVGYKVIALGPGEGYLAIGMNLQPLSDLQRQLIEAQQALERDYWRLRQVETRYRLLFQRSVEAVLLLEASTFKVLDANRAAGRVFGMPARKLAGTAFPDDLALDSAARDEVRSHLMGVRDRGRSETLTLSLVGGEEWRMEASLVREERDGVLLVHLSEVAPRHEGPSHPRGVDVLRLLERAPDAYVVTDRSARILIANRAFLQLVQVNSEEDILGQSLGRWLGRPGADLTVLLTNLEKFGEVRLFPTTIYSALDLESEVEISAVLTDHQEPPCIGITIRNVSRRIGGGEPTTNREVFEALENMTGQIGKVSLKELVNNTVALVEEHFIEAALNLTDGNRTAAAEILGVSRQSLYTKLRRYDVDAPDPS